MEAKDIISIISIVFSSVLGILGWYTGWKERIHSYEYTEKNNEKTKVVEIITGYICAASIIQVKSILKRATAEAAVEPVESFINRTDVFLDNLEKWTFEVLSIPEILSSDLSEKIYELKNQYYSAILDIIDLKAMCMSVRRDNGAIGSRTISIINSLDRLEGSSKEIIIALRIIVSEYNNRVKREYPEIIMRLIKYIRSNSNNSQNQTSAKE